MAEFIQGKPIFPGKTEPEQIKLIFKVSFWRFSWNNPRIKLRNWARPTTRSGQGSVSCPMRKKSFGSGIRTINCASDSRTRLPRLATIWWRGTYSYFFNDHLAFFHISVFIPQFSVSMISAKRPVLIELGANIWLDNIGDTRKHRETNTGLHWSTTPPPPTAPRERERKSHTDSPAFILVVAPNTLLRLF